MKDTTINLRLSKELKLILENKAKEANKTSSELLREAIINNKVSHNNSKHISQLIASINKIGNNVNQIAHNLNIARNANNIDEISFENLLLELQNINYHLQDILSAVKC
ncbi:MULTISPECIES: plasmid mobilization protein [Helicobacter]|uniref:Uncharacterized protein n=1 Tax=Helicobacter bilis ATCC 43879 TaxID=613026 RepID=C3XJ69_9HELI|nr:MULTISPECIES: ribbon-helix-helix protein, CopG family [Helicobacter]EEO25058.1 hypothetical protein HRAG_02115 [Helicobacter bilis ATCC 43879]